MFLLALVNFNNRKRLLLDEQKRIESAYREEILATKVEMQEQTFREISEEIHDNIGQNLSLLKLTIFNMDTGNNKQLLHSIESCKTMITTSIKDLRNLSHALNPDLIETIGLAAAIERQLQIIEKTNLYKTSFLCTGSPGEISLQKELILLRIVQEVLNNTIKHAMATEITVTLEYGDNSIKVCVSDNGKGFDTEQYYSESHNGIGLRNITNRAHLIGGKINLFSSSDMGTQVIISIGCTE